MTRYTYPSRQATSLPLLGAWPPARLASWLSTYVTVRVGFLADCAQFAVLS